MNVERSSTIRLITGKIREGVSCMDFLEKSKGHDMYCCPLCGSGHGQHGTGAVKYYSDTNTWYCFSCNTGGDVITLYQKAEGLEFMPAMKALAQQLGIDADAEFAAADARANDNQDTTPRTIENEVALYVQDAQEVFVVNGALDMMSIQMAGGEAIALNGTANVPELIKHLADHPTKSSLIIALERDQSATAKDLADSLEQLDIPHIVADLNLGGKSSPFEASGIDRDGFTDAVMAAMQKARERKAQLEKDRQLRTGPGMIDAFMEKIQTKLYEPIPTGISDLDKALGGGLIRQQIVLLGAAPGAGKTALAAWIFEGMAKRGVDCIFMNLEMSREQLLARSLSRIARANGDRITPTEILQGYRWTEEQREMVQDAAAEYRRDIAPHMIYNPQGQTAKLDSIISYAEAEAARAELAGNAAPILILDYLQVIEGEAREDTASLIQRTMKQLKAFAINHNTVVFAIMAQNREANKAGYSDQNSGRDSSNLEYGADILLGLDFTESLDNKKAASSLTEDEKNRKTLRVLKNRSGRNGVKIDLVFDGESMTFYQLETRREPHQQMKASKRF